MIGKLTLIVGPMYSGKTSELLSLVEIYSLGKKKYLVFKPEIDTRYSVDHVVSHTGQKVPAITIPSASKLLEKFDDINEKLDAIFIDEVHFFDIDIIDVIKKIILKGVDVFCVGLDMSYKHRPFQTTASLMAIADEVIKKKAVCHVCGEYKAVVSHKTVNNSGSEIDVGGMEKYIAVCRECYLKLNGSL
ncbi:MULTISPECIES: thymidine kinase [Kosmotoga]|uniref:Thymidine kinase n=1 Tax=Kosmotoga olearia (strain ATCC BAA-1733 / DSM 21960 / TBF 19.5.1) TaxID=521045 RepID=C5CEB1_KOSOT|nr:MULTISPECIES: thymidine kinase [Kosmotoga]ACR80151.1 Thymidine kinase [Kosmotoga olearia TBF 19.5.1]MDI3523714.1 thymidine kinase [Kosmotoga sp.]MDK2953226.1 thymidine kinase [Kosmotoga sp.]OAA20340.1 thymidine kinase [Kosmotoga sp. DU53]